MMRTHKKKKSVQWGSSSERIFRCDECPTAHEHDHDHIESNLDGLSNHSFGRHPNPSDMERSQDFLRTVLLPQAEEHFLLRQFLFCIEDSYLALSRISERYKTDWTDFIDQPIVDDKNNKRNTSINREKMQDVLNQLNRLSHQCTPGYPCDCVGFMVLIIQSLFEIKEVIPHSILVLLKNIYGDLNTTPSRVLFLSVNGLIKRNQLEDAKNVLESSLNTKSSQIIADKSKQLSEIEIEEYENLTQLLLFHTYPGLDQWDHASTRLEEEAILPSWKIEGFKSHLRILKEQADEQAAALSFVKEQPQPVKPAAVIPSEPIKSQSITTAQKTFFDRILDNLRGKAQMLAAIFSSTSLVALLVIFMAWRKRSLNAIKNKAGDLANKKMLEKGRKLFGGPSKIVDRRSSQGSSNVLGGVFQLLSSLVSMGRTTY